MKVNILQANILNVDESQSQFIKKWDHFIASVYQEFPEHATSIMNVAIAIQKIATSKTRKLRGAKGHIMFEFCCSDGSNLGKLNAERGIDYIQLMQSLSNMSDQ